MSALTQTQHSFDVLLKFAQRSHHSLQTDMASVELVQGQLALRLRHWHLALTMDDVTEIISPTNLTRVPGVKPWLLGIANLRGTIITIIDLGQFLGIDEAPTSNTQRVIVIHYDGWHYGLQIDELLGLRHFNNQQPITLDQALPESIDKHLKPYVKTALIDQQQTWLNLDVNALVSDNRF